MNPQDQANAGNSHQDSTITVADEVQLSPNDFDPKRLKKSAGGKACCIFRIPQSLARMNPSAYEPKTVSIGPYHHGKEKLEMIQEHKRRFLEFFAAKTQEKGVGMQHLINAVSVLEKDIRNSYSETLVDLDQKKLVDMMVLDGCFILTLFLVVAKKAKYSTSEDPIFKMPWLLPSIRSDLLLLENQVPFFLLQTLFETSKLVTSCGLNEIVYKFFSYSIEKPNGFWEKHRNLEAKHLLDLIRQTFVPLPPQEYPKQSCLVSICCSDEVCGTETQLDSRPFLKLILSAKRLHLRGIDFKPRKEAETLLDIRLERGVLQIPPLALDEFISSVFLNCVAFEQFYSDSRNHITSYVAFMGCLLNNEDDAVYLSNKGIIENYFGTGAEVSLFFKNIGKEVAFHLKTSYLANVFEGVNEYTSRGCHVQWAGFKHTHFNSPWTCLSSCAALTLLVLTLIQAFYAAYGYYKPRKGH